LGFEADIQASGQRGSGTFVDPFSTPICITETLSECVGTAPLNGTATTAYEAKIGWFGTVRGRFGGLITDQVLLYGTGGLAYGGVKVSGNTNISGSSGNILFTPTGTAYSASRTNVGFSVGGGVEGKFSLWLPANWTWKLEYLYLDLGSLEAVSSFSAPTSALSVLPLTGSITAHTHFADNILRVGLNYQFH
jgi:outer membrane immunogenic protein